jgi:hypothetical protein
MVIRYLLILLTLYSFSSEALVAGLTDNNEIQTTPKTRKAPILFLMGSKGIHKRIERDVETHLTKLLFIKLDGIIHILSHPQIKEYRTFQHQLMERFGVLFLDDLKGKIVEAIPQKDQIRTHSGDWYPIAFLNDDWENHIPPSAPFSRCHPDPRKEFKPTPISELQKINLKGKLLTLKTPSLIIHSNSERLTKKPQVIVNILKEQYLMTYEARSKEDGHFHPLQLSADFQNVMAMMYSPQFVYGLEEQNVSILTETLERLHPIELGIVAKQFPLFRKIQAEITAATQELSLEPEGMSQIVNKLERQIDCLAKLDTQLRCSDSILKRIYFEDEYKKWLKLLAELCRDGKQVYKDTPIEL